MRKQIYKNEKKIGKKKQKKSSRSMKESPLRLLIPNL